KKEALSVEIDNQDEIRVTTEDLGDNGKTGGDECVSEFVDEIRAKCDAINGTKDDNFTKKITEYVVPNLDQVNDDETMIADSTDKVRMGKENDSVTHKSHDEVETDMPNVGTSKSNKQCVSNSTISPIRATYASMTSNNAKLDRTLDFEPTLTEDDNEFVIFDEDLVNNGSLLYVVILWKKGISKLASSVGKPLVMDEMTTNMCQYGRGRVGYARVLVEVDARKKFKEWIEVRYRDNSGSILRTKKIRLNTHGSLMKDVNKEAFTDVKRKQHKQNNIYKKNQQANIGRRYNLNNNDGKNKNVTVEKYAYRPREKQSHVNHIESNKENQNASNCNEEETGIRLDQEQRKEVDYFMDQRLQPTPFEISKWSHLIVNYFKDRWEDGYDIGLAGNDDDVIEELSGTCIIDNEIKGMEEGNSPLHQ
nr:zinc knuckle CX2CX4HX4C [Tanacetum cinerariifolium]